MSVSDLLAASRAAHEQYKLHVPRMIPTGIGSVVESQGDPTEARRNILDAARLRREAEAADPTFTDPAWQAEPVPHKDLMAYYEQVAK